MDRQQNNNPLRQNPQESDTQQLVHGEAAKSAADGVGEASAMRKALQAVAPHNTYERTETAAVSVGATGEAVANEAAQSAAVPQDGACRGVDLGAAPQGEAVANDSAQQAQAGEAVSQAFAQLPPSLNQAAQPPYGQTVPQYSGQAAQATYGQAAQAAYGVAQPSVPPYPAYGHPMQGSQDVGAYAPPAYGAPVYGTPQGAGVYAPPAYGAPQPYATPPVYGTPQPYATPPIYGAPPAYGTPQPYVAPPTYGAPSTYGARAQAPVRPATYARGEGAAPPPKASVRRKRGCLIVMGVCMLCVAAAVLGVSVWQSNQKPEPVDPATLPSVSITELPEDLDKGLSATEIAKQVNPSVVSIDAKVAGMWETVGIASGIVMSADGYIITNQHVADNSDYPEILGLLVTLDDGRSFEATVVGVDERTDLAVLKIKADGLKPAQFGDSTQLQIGERVLAIGNAAGEYAGSITQGIISGLNRELSFGDGTPTGYDLIQTDAAINPGNSGGALVNRFGQVIGINVAKIGGSKFEGMGFAIPIAQAKPVVEALMQTGFVERAVLGVVVEPIGPAWDEAESEDAPQHGLYILSVDSGSDLNRHDITAGDVILSANGKKMTKTGDIAQELLRCKPGDTMVLEVQKGGSKKMLTVEVVLIASTPS